MMDFCDYDKRTPLHLAAAEGHTDVVKFLIEDCGVDAEVKDRYLCLISFFEDKQVNTYDTG